MTVKTRSRYLEGALYWKSVVQLFHLLVLQVAKTLAFYIPTKAKTWGKMVFDKDLLMLFDQVAGETIQVLVGLDQRSASAHGGLTSLL